ncbi:uncharacterized protein C8Q71DRAFT_721603 [Rhodofomes roseus]|uniref:Uncharacterized protein n=1 Tax=Rhodofomes roseus TaxID=34475 RepID=A0ABQ8KN79_9APHY|nr:uncharacterized protein C8Q71DRAFT_721603 [Rhodofomes roseus]KAH9839761.1 hypothetical protein C8Q71DRAFT_721603 [Rhodofomes roseus]
MTWVLGWPLYNEDALEIAKKHNLAPRASDARRISAAKTWVVEQVGVIRALSCWVQDMPELVYAVYVDHGDNRYPPSKLVREQLILPGKQYRRLKQAMPLKNFGWTHECVSETTVDEYDSEEDEENSNDDDGSDDDSNDGSHGGSDDEEWTTAASNADGEDATESDSETVTDGVVPDAGPAIPEATESLPREFGCRIVETRP